MCRVTIDGTISQFSWKLTIDPKIWDVAADRPPAEAIRHLPQAANRMPFVWVSTGIITTFSSVRAILTPKKLNPHTRD